MKVVQLVADLLVAKGYTSVYRHKAPADIDAICVYQASNNNRNTANDGLSRYRDETLEIEITRKKIQGTDDSAIEYVREKIFQDICRAPVTDKLVKISRDRESDVAQDSTKGRYYYSMWIVVTALL
jgi:hypothetical protein